MHHEPHFRTYLINLWLVWFCILPISILIILGLADSFSFKDETHSLLFVTYTLMALIFIIPGVLYILSISALLTRFTSNVQKFRIFTISLIILGLIITAIIVYKAVAFTTEQLLYGVFFLLLYTIGIIFSGLKFKI